jgi:hypothetical protein
LGPVPLGIGDGCLPSDGGQRQTRTNDTRRRDSNFNHPDKPRSKNGGFGHAHPLTFYPRAIAQDDADDTTNTTIAVDPTPPRPLQLDKAPSTAHSNPHARHRRKVRPHCQPNSSPCPRPKTTPRRPSAAPRRYRLGRTRGSPSSDRADIPTCQECHAEWIAWELVLALGLGCQG